MILDIEYLKNDIKSSNDIMFKLSNGPSSDDMQLLRNRIDNFEVLNGSNRKLIGELEKKLK